MFIRFRRKGRRLYASLAENSRIDGRVHQTHVSALGSVPIESLMPTPSDDASKLSAQHRFKFWKTLHEVMARLGNRIDAATAERMMRQVHERIPMPMPEESQSMELWAAEGHATSWRSIQGQGLKMIEANERIIRRAQEQIAELRIQVEREGKTVESWEAKALALKAKGKWPST